MGDHRIVNTLYRSLALMTIALTLSAAPSSAWEEKGHMLINRLAAEAMPPDTPAFFRNAVEQLSWLGPEPDRWKADSGPQLYAVNGNEHFMDLEPLAALTLPDTRYRYIAMVEEKGLALKGYPADKLGFLPYRIAELTQVLQNQWQRWGEAKDGSAAKAQLEQNIIYTAGVLGHYVGDASNPHHTTIHHNGWDTSFAANPGGFTTAEEEQAKRPNGIHHRFEGPFVNAFIRIEDVRPLMQSVKPAPRVFEWAVDYLKASNAEVERLYALEKGDAFRIGGEANPEALAFVQKRLAIGASRLRDVWTTAIKGTAIYRRTRSAAPSRAVEAATP